MPYQSVSAPGESYHFFNNDTNETQLKALAKLKSRCVFLFSHFRAEYDGTKLSQEDLDNLKKASALLGVKNLSLSGLF